MSIILPAIAIVAMLGALILIAWAVRRVSPDYVPRAQPPPHTAPEPERGTVVVARHLPDGTDTPPETAAALLASRPARAQITGPGNG